MNRNHLKRILTIIISLVLLFGIPVYTPKATESTPLNTESERILEAAAETPEQILLTVHQQTYGTLEPAPNGEPCGLKDDGKRLEAFSVTRVGNTNVEGTIEYRAHCQTYGWMDWTSGGQMAGSSGQSKRLEAIQIRLTGEMAEKYDIYYRTFMRDAGWLDWTKNEGVSGTLGQSSVLCSIQVLLVEKDSENAPRTGRYAAITPEMMNTITYSGHAQTFGDLAPVANGTSLGSTGQAKRLEGIQISLSHNADQIFGKLTYRVHVQNYGWLTECAENAYAGTRGEAKRMEAIEIKLSGDLATWGCGQNPGHFDTVKDYGVTLFQRAGSCRTHVV